MAFLYCTGPALIYVGISVQWTDVLSSIFQLPPEAQFNPPPDSPFDAVLRPTITTDFGPPVGGAIVVNLVPPPTALVPPPVHVFIEQLFSTYVPVFLGTAESAPTIQIIPSWDAVETDAGGTENPSDRLTEGEEAAINLTITRWNEPVYLAIAARAQANAFLGQFPGWGQVGKAIALEGLTFPLWLVFPYTGKNRFLLTGQPPGYRFYRGFLDGPDQLKNLGTVPRVTELNFGAQRLLQLTESVADLLQPIVNYSDIANPNPLLPVGQVFTGVTDSSIGGLYDFDMTGLPLPN